MNGIRQIRELNKRELENGVSPEASWHTDYRDTAYIYIGGLPLNLSEGDVITIFSQYGEPTYINLVRDKETGKSKGFAFLKYEDQRSTDLAVDNLGGATIMGRVLKVDHTRYKKKDDEEEQGHDVSQNAKINSHSSGEERDYSRGDSKHDKAMVREEGEFAGLLENPDDEDPMKEYILNEKRKEADAARERSKRDKSSREDRKRHRHRHSHRERHRSNSRS